MIRLHVLRGSWRMAALVIGLCALPLVAVPRTQSLLSRLFGKHRAEDEIQLVSGTAVLGTLELEEANSAAFVLDLPKDVVALRVKLQSKEAELDLYANPDEKIGDDTQAAAHVTTESGEASLHWSRFDPAGLAFGRTWFKVAWDSDDRPRTSDKRVQAIHFSLEAQVFRARVDGKLAPEAPLTGRLERTSGAFRTYTVEVPKGTQLLRLDLADVDTDLDLFARHGAQVLELDDRVRFAQHTYGRETLILGATRVHAPGSDSTPGNHSKQDTDSKSGTVPERSTDTDPSPVLEPGKWYVDVVDTHDEERPCSFRLLATFGADPPAELLVFPALAPLPPGRVLSRALSAVVELETDDGTGSGTLLTPDGWILTNAHVVAALGGEPLDEVVVSCTLDPHKPPVELFRGAVRRVDKERDLALVEIVRGFYGQPLPAAWKFLTVELGDPDALAIGDTIYLVGYPGTGGQGSRVTIHCTRGVLSGFDESSFGTVLKTDAEITGGNSGGAALDEQGRIVGVPTSLVESSSGQTAFLHPLSALPAEWRALIDEHRGR